jgi:hypothetical protein
MRKGISVIRPCAIATVVALAGSFFVAPVTALQPKAINIHSGKGIPAAVAQKGKTYANVAAASPCTGAFSGGGSINVSQPIFLNDVPQGQIFCDFHTFAWNQFIYLTQMQADPNDGGAVTPLFLHLAPWYNVLLPDGSAAPGPYPGGSTALEGAGLDQGQAGDDDHLVDVNGATVLYDIRFDQTMYDAIVSGGLYTQTGFAKACQPNSTGQCANPLWLPPTTTTTPAAPGSLEIKTAWRDFGTPAACPGTQFYCNGRFGLVGMHLVQKTQTHGEWIWASFEHVANDPDCYPGGDTPIAAASPLGTPWSFFNPKAAASGVMSSGICEVTGAAPQCNGNPKSASSQKASVYSAINVCRTDALPPGGANTINCAAVPDGPPQQNSNSGGNVACLNATLRPKLKGVWQNYKMIGSLWLRGTTGPTQPFTIQIFQQPESGVPNEQPVGFPNMANTTMETWMQWGSTGYDPFGTNATQAGCFLCHNLPTNFQPGSGTNADDLSHFPGKLPTEKQTQLRKSLLPASSTRKVN